MNGDGVRLRVVKSKGVLGAGAVEDEAEVVEIRAIQVGRLDDETLGRGGGRFGGAAPKGDEGEQDGDVAAHDEGIT